MTIETPVLIVGGGGAGLTASMLLSKLNVEHILVSSLPHTQCCPRRTCLISARWKYSRK
jgi:2,4-dichlorophenol 6-monooxygenase